MYFAAFLLAASQISAQNVVRGRVVDKDGLPIPGARVSVKGGTESVLSDFDGSYRMIVEGEVEKLIVDDDFREECSKKAFVYASEYSWERAMREHMEYLGSFVK